MIELASESLLERIVAILPPQKYQNLSRFEEELGGTREIFVANWGRHGERKVAVKVDKSPKSRNAEYHVRRGYTTSHEIDISLKIEPEDAVRHNIIPLIDYYERDGLTVSVEPWFENSKSLRRIVEELGALTPTDFREAFSQVLEAVRFLIKEKGLYHRDLNPSNILIRRGDRGVEARITDLANACPINEVTAKSRPTAGARLVTDPCLGSTFTGSQTQYDERSEIYALGVNMLLALTGKTAFEYDIDNGTAVQHYAGIRSVLDQEGRLDNLAHNWILGEAVDKIPWRARKFREIVHDCMAAERSARISSIDELIERFNEAKEPSLSGKITARWKGVAAAILAGLLATGSTLYLTNKTEELEAQVEESNKYKVVVQWSGRNLEISNNLTDISIYAHTSNLESYVPREDYLLAQPGDTLWIRVGLQSRPEPNKRGITYYSLIGKVYVEGLPGEKFGVTPIAYNQNEFAAEGHYGGEASIVLPTTLPEGTYILAAEIYAPDVSKFTEEKREDFPYHFDQPGKVMNRKRIPLVVGNPSETVYVLGYDRDVFRRLEFRNVGDDGSLATHLDWYMNKEINYEIGILESGLQERKGRDQYAVNVHFVGIQPACHESGEYTLVGLAKSDERIISSTYLPIEIRPVSNHDCSWELSIPGKEFSEKIEQYHRELFAHE